MLGYCVGSVYAAQLAERLGELQGLAPDVLVFDPEPAAATGMLGELLSLADRLGPILTPDESADLRAAADHAATRGADLPAVGIALVAVFRQVAVSALLRSGIRPNAVRDVVDRFTATLAYISQAGRFDPVTGWSTATALTSRPAPAYARYAERTVSFDVPRSTLLSNPEVAREVAALLAGCRARS